MIKDRLENAALYTGCHPAFARAFEFLSEKAGTLPAGRYELDGDKLFAVISETVTHGPETGLFETHRHHIDVQYIRAGEEVFEVTPAETLTPAGEYDEALDFTYFEGTGSFIRMTPGDFLVFFPHDGHRPCLSPDGKEGRSEKVIVKVLL